MDMTLTCASDAYKVQSVGRGGRCRRRGEREWTETAQNIGGSIRGRGGNGSFQVVAEAAGFSASIA